MKVISVRNVRIQAVDSSRVSIDWHRDHSGVWKLAVSSSHSKFTRSKKTGSVVSADWEHTNRLVEVSEDVEDA